MATNRPLAGSTLISEELFEAAAIWHARLREPDAADHQAAFDAWLKADPRHSRAYDEIEQLWPALAQPTAQVMAETAVPTRADRRTRRRSSVRWQAAAAVLLLVAAVGVLSTRGLIDDLRSDYVTGTSDTRSIILADGSEVMLNTDTAIALSYQARRRDVRLFRGEAWFNVASDPARPFEVETAEGTVRVTGTRFNVRETDSGSVVVSLVEGRVALQAASPAADALDLAAGQQAVMTAAAIGTPTGFDEAGVTAWRRGQLVFYQTPLEQVVEQLNRYRRGRIIIASDKLRGLRVSGVFATGEPDAALAVMRDTLGLGVIQLGSYLVLLR